MTNEVNILLLKLFPQSHKSQC